MTDTALLTLNAKLDRLIAAIDRLGPASALAPDFSASDCFVWDADHSMLSPVARVNRVDLSLIRSVNHVRDILFDNTRRFADGLPSNNVLLWGARGMGKSSLVKSVHYAIAATQTKDQAPLKLVEIHREDINSLPKLMALVKAAPCCSPLRKSSLWMRCGKPLSASVGKSGKSEERFDVLTASAFTLPPFFCADTDNALLQSTPVVSTPIINLFIAIGLIMIRKMIMVFTISLQK